MSPSFLRLAGWSAYTATTIHVTSMMFLGLFFAIGGPWGLVNDGLTVFWMAALVPVALALDGLHRSSMGNLSLGAAVIGITAMTVFGILHGLLALQRIDFGATMGYVLVVAGFIGLFLLLFGLMSLSADVLPRRLAWITVCFGLTYMVGAVGYLSGGHESPVAMTGMMLSPVLHVIWGVMIGRFLLRNHATLADRKRPAV